MNLSSQKFAVAVVLALAWISVGIVYADPAPAPAPTPRQLGMDSSFVVAAENGLIQFTPAHGGRWTRKEISATGAALESRLAQAGAQGKSIIDMRPFDLISALRRVDSLRVLDGTSWSALSMVVAFRLDGALARGDYRYVLVSDGGHDVLFERASAERVRMRTFAHASGERQAAFLKKHHLAAGSGYAFEVPELTQDRAGSDHLVERLENVGVSRSALLEELVAGRA